MEIVIPDEWNFRRFPNQNRMQLDPAENLESDTNAFVGWDFAFDASPLSDSSASFLTMSIGKDRASFPRPG